MPENRGFYQKYNVSRVDGKPIIGPIFTLDLGSDKFAKIAVKAYADAAREELPLLVEDLDKLVKTY